MARILYEPKKFQQKSLDIIEQADRICRAYALDGYDLTLRQLYYQFVARDLLQNNQKNYNRLGNIINDARMAGKLDWNYIVDRTRNFEELPHWDDPEDALAAIASQYRFRRWDHQPVHVEVWIEKDALVGVLEAICPRLDVGYFSCRGYTSQSEMWGAAQRLRKAMEKGHEVLVLHLGDHDPSGIDMTRDIEDRLRTFIYNDWYNFSWLGAQTSGSSSFSAIRKNMVARINDQRSYFDHDVPELADGANPFEVRRIALTMEQIEQYDPPPNFAKMSDSRYEKYVEEQGTEDSWELDALPPEVLTGLIREHVEDSRDDDIWQTTTDEMEEDREIMTSISNDYASIKEFIASGLSVEDVRRVRDAEDGPDDPTDPQE